MIARSSLNDSLRDLLQNESASWRKSLHSPVGAGTACVEALLMVIQRRPDDVIGMYSGQPPYMPAPAPTGASDAQRARPTLVAETPAEPGAWVRGSRNGLIGEGLAGFTTHLAEPMAAAPTPLSVRNADELRRLVDGLLSAAAADAAGEGSLVDCVTALTRLLPLLHPAASRSTRQPFRLMNGVHSASASDDSIVGTGSVEQTLVPGPGWHDVFHYPTLVQLAEEHGRGTTVVVLAQRRRAIGHALAFHHGSDGVLVIDPLAPAPDRVRSAATDVRSLLSLPALARGRFILIGSDGTTILRPLRREQAELPAPDTAQALIDPPIVHAYGAASVTQVEQDIPPQRLVSSDLGTAGRSLSPGRLPDREPASLNDRFGHAVLPKKVKDGELDDRGDVRVNPLWYRLEDFKTTLLERTRARWLYAIDEHGEMFIGSEDVASITEPDELDRLLDGMRAKDPELTREALLLRLTDQGVPTIAAGFRDDGAAHVRPGRVGGELFYNPAAGRWEIDASSRYMHPQVRPGVDLVDITRWVRNAAERMSAVLGVEIVALSGDAPRLGEGTYVAGTGTAEHDRRFGPLAGPKKVKDSELDDQREVKVNPLWYRLEDFKPTLLERTSGIWHFAVDEDGRILIGSEQPLSVIEEEELQELLQNMQSRDPGLSMELLKQALAAQGHPTLAVGFASDGTTRVRPARIAGELTYNHQLARWEVSDKSGRYMSLKVRPGLEADSARTWLANVAARVSEVLHVPITPVLFKNARPAPAGEPETRPVDEIIGSMALQQQDTPAPSGTSDPPATTNAADAVAIAASPARTRDEPHAPADGPPESPAVPDNPIRQGRLSGMTLVMSLGDAEHPDDYLSQRLNHVLTENYGARTAEHAMSQLAPSLSLEILRPDLVWRANGGRWRLPRLQHGLLSGYILVSVTLDEAELTDDVADKAEIEAGGAVWASAGTMADSRNRATVGVAGKGTFGIFQSTLNLAASRDWHDGAQVGDTGQQFSRGKIKEARTMIAATARYTFDLSGLTWRGPSVGPGRAARRPGDRTQEFEEGVPARLRVPRAETLNLPPARRFLPSPDIQRSRALDGSAFVTETYPLAPDGAAAGGGFATALAAGATEGRRLFPRDWDDVRDELLDRIDLATLQTWLKSIMRQGESLEFELEGCGVMVRLGFELERMSHVRDLGEVEFNVGSSISRSFVKLAGKGKSGQLSAVGQAKFGDEDGGGFFSAAAVTGADRYEISTESVLSGTAVKFKSQGLLFAGSGTLVLTFVDHEGRPVHGTYSGIRLPLGFQAVTEKTGAQAGTPGRDRFVAGVEQRAPAAPALLADAARGEAVARLDSSAEAVESRELPAFPAFMTPLGSVPPVERAPGEIVLQPPSRFLRGGGLRDTDVVWELSVGDFDASLTEAGRSFFTAAQWNDHASQVRGSHRAARIAAHLHSMTNGVPMRSPLLAAGVGIGHHQVSTIARIVHIDYLRRFENADLNVLNELGEASADRAFQWAQYGGYAQLGGSGAVGQGPEHFKLTGAPGPGGAYTMREGSRVATGAKAVSNGRYAVPMVLFRIYGELSTQFDYYGVSGISGFTRDAIDPHLHRFSVVVAVPEADTLPLTVKQPGPMLFVATGLPAMSRLRDNSARGITADPQAVTESLYVPQPPGAAADEDLPPDYAVELGQITFSDTLLSLPGREEAIEQIDRRLRQVGIGAFPAFMSQLMAQLEGKFTRSTLRPLVAALIAGKFWGASGSAGGWQVVVWVERAAITRPDGMKHRFTARSYEYEYGVDTESVAGTANDHTVEKTVGGTFKASAAVGNVTGSAAFSTNSTTSRTYDRSATSVSRAKPVVPASVFTGEVELELHYRIRRFKVPVPAEPSMVSIPMAVAFPTSRTRDASGRSRALDLENRRPLKWDGRLDDSDIVSHAAPRHNHLERRRARFETVRSANAHRLLRGDFQPSAGAAGGDLSIRSGGSVGRAPSQTPSGSFGFARSISIGTSLLSSPTTPQQDLMEFYRPALATLQRVLGRRRGAAAHRTVAHNAGFDLLHQQAKRMSFGQPKIFHVDGGTVELTLYTATYFLVDKVKTAEFNVSFSGTLTVTTLDGDTGSSSGGANQVAVSGQAVVGPVPGQGAVLGLGLSHSRGVDEVVSLQSAIRSGGGSKSKHTGDEYQVGVYVRLTVRNRNGGRTGVADIPFDLRLLSDTRTSITLPAGREMFAPLLEAASQEPQLPVLPALRADESATPTGSGPVIPASARPARPLGAQRRLPTTWSEPSSSAGAPIPLITIEPVEPVTVEPTPASTPATAVRPPAAALSPEIPELHLPATLKNWSHERSLATPPHGGAQPPTVRIPPETVWTEGLNQTDFVVRAPRSLEGLYGLIRTFGADFFGPGFWAEHGDLIVSTFSADQIAAHAVAMSRHPSNGGAVPLATPRFGVGPLRTRRFRASGQIELSLRLLSLEYNGSDEAAERVATNESSRRQVVSRLATRQTGAQGQIGGQGTAGIATIQGTLNVGGARRTRAGGVQTLGSRLVQTAKIPTPLDLYEGQFALVLNFRNGRRSRGVGPGVIPIEVGIWRRPLAAAAALRSSRWDGTLGGDRRPLFTPDNPKGGMPAEASDSQDQTASRPGTVQSLVGLDESGGSGALGVRPTNNTGHGGLKRHAGGRVLQKSTNATEAGFYREVRELPENDPLRDVVPISHSASDVARMEGVDPAAVADDDSHIFIEDIARGMSSPQLLDVKIGARTASRHELQRHLSDASAWLKKNKLRVADRVTGSASRGYRVVGGTGLQGSRLEIGRDSVAHLRDYASAVSAGEGWSIEALAARLRDKVKAIRDAAERSGYAFLGASVLMAVDREPQEVEHAVDVKLIDFAHVLRADDLQVERAQYDKYAGNFHEGINSLIRQLDSIAAAHAAGRPATSTGTRMFSTSSNPATSNDAETRHQAEPHARTSPPTDGTVRRTGPHVDIDSDGVGWASSRRSALDGSGQLIPRQQRSCVEVTVITLAG